MIAGCFEKGERVVLQVLDQVFIPNTLTSTLYPRHLGERKNTSSDIKPLFFWQDSKVEFSLIH